MSRIKQKQEPINEETMAQAEQELEEQQYQEAYESLKKKQSTVNTDAERDMKLIKIDYSSAQRRKSVIDDGKRVVVNVPMARPEGFHQDMVLGNLSDIEISASNYLTMVVDILEGFEETRGIDFSDLKEFFLNEAYYGIDFSRSRGGFQQKMIKEMKHISEGMVQHVQKGLEEAAAEKKAKRWGLF